MRILKPENESFDTSKISYHGDNNLYYCVLDYSSVQEADYQFPPLIFVDEYSKPGVELQIGDSILQVPWDWSLLMGDKNFEELEVIEIKKFHGRDFDAFVFNPISGYMPDFYSVKVINYYNEIRWTCPVISNEHLLAIPLSAGKEPLCAFFAPPKHKLPEVLDVVSIFS